MDDPWYGYSRVLATLRWCPYFRITEHGVGILRYPRVNLHADQPHAYGAIEYGGWSDILAINADREGVSNRLHP